MLELHGSEKSAHAGKRPPHNQEEAVDFKFCRAPEVFSGSSEGLDGQETLAKLREALLSDLPLEDQDRVYCILRRRNGKEDLSIFVIGNGQDNLPARIMEKVDNFLHNL